MPTATPPPAPDRSFWKRLQLGRWRPWVQAGFVPLWLSPFGAHWLSVPGCAFHCYGCPLSTFACPIGVMAHFSALHILPALALGVVLLVGSLVGSLVCGWMCPFGFLQDLLARVPLRKWRLPDWVGYGRYVVLVGLVFLVPALWGDETWAFFCRLCPAGALEAAAPAMAADALAGRPVAWMSPLKTTILVAVLGTALVVYRPWCRILCPLGGLLALCNRYSLLYLRFDGAACTACNLCRTRCRYDVKVDLQINNSSCIRCLECTNCSAIRPALGGLGGRSGGGPCSGAGGCAAAQQQDCPLPPVADKARS